MTLPDVRRPGTPQPGTRLPRIAVWVALGGLIVATVIGVVMVLVGTADDIAPRALLTVILIAAFTGVIFLDASLASRRPVWFVLTSMGVWVATLLIGAVMVWMPAPPVPGVYSLFQAPARVVAFLLIVLILQLAVLYVRLFVKGWEHHRTPLVNVIARVTIVLAILLTVMLVFPLMLGGWVVFHDIYWRLVVAIAILAAVGTALVPLVTALLTPGGMPRGRASYGRGVGHGVGHGVSTHAAPAWPTYPDGVTPLPIGPDGQPLWDAPRYGADPRGVASRLGQAAAGAPGAVPVASYAPPRADTVVFPVASPTPSQAWVPPAPVPPAAAAGPAAPAESTAPAESAAPVEPAGSAEPTDSAEDDVRRDDPPTA